MASTKEVAVHEDVALSSMEFDEELDGYLYECPCGDEFYISIEDLKNGVNIAECPSCSLKIRIIFDHQEFLQSLAGSAVANETNQSAVAVH